jgi:hypothetical protein
LTYLQYYHTVFHKFIAFYSTLNYSISNKEKTVLLILKYSLSYLYLISLQLQKWFVFKYNVCINHFVMVCKYYNVIINIRAVRECLTQILDLIWGQVNFENKWIFQIFSLFTVKTALV